MSSPRALGNWCWSHWWFRVTNSCSSQMLGLRLVKSVWRGRIKILLIFEHFLSIANKDLAQEVIRLLLELFLLIKSLTVKSQQNYLTRCTNKGALLWDYMSSKLSMWINPNRQYISDLLAVVYWVPPLLMVHSFSLWFFSWLFYLHSTVLRLSDLFAGVMLANLRPHYITLSTPGNKVAGRSVQGRGVAYWIKTIYGDEV